MNGLGGSPPRTSDTSGTRFQWHEPSVKFHSVGRKKQTSVWW